MEGSDSRDKSYKCNGEGEYTLPIDALSGLPEFPSCIPRRMNCFLRYYILHIVLYFHRYIHILFFFTADTCKCLGEYRVENYSISALDLYCRNDTYIVMESIARDPVTKDPLQQIVPNKTRCGSTDPLEMNEETKCYCYTKDDRGSSKLFFLRIFILILIFIFISIPMQQKYLKVKCKYKWYY